MSISTAQTASSNGRRRRLLLGLAVCFGALLFSAAFFPRVAGSFQKSYWGLNAAHYQRLMSRLPRSVQESLESELAEFDQRHRTRPPDVKPESGRLPPLAQIVVTPDQPGSIVRYTLDGSTPTAASPRWAPDMAVGGPVLVRARSFSKSAPPSQTVTRAYVTGIDDSLPVLSLAIEPVHLSDHRAGLFANPEGRGRVWERPAVLTLLPSGAGTSVESEIRIRVHGGVSRRSPHKRLRLLAPAASPEMQSALGAIVGLEPDSVDNWVLHHPARINQIYRQKLGNRLAREMGLFAPPAASCVVLINGEYWGVCDLMARVDARLVAQRKDTDGVTLLRGALANPVAAIGTTEEWNRLYRLIEERDLRDEGVFQRVASAIDLENLIDVWAYYIFVADYDRPHNNMEIYTDLMRDQRWRFIVYDTDFGFNFLGLHLGHDTLAWHLRDQPRSDLKVGGIRDDPELVRSTLLFRKLMTRGDFKTRFRARFEQLLNGVLSSERTRALFDRVLHEVEPFREVELSGYSPEAQSETMLQRAQEISYIRDFLEQRPAVVRRLLAEHGNEGGDL